ncbi:MAG: aryl-sulfate sulfotransferase [bacterium]
MIDIKHIAKKGKINYLQLILTIVLLSIHVQIGNILCENNTWEITVLDNPGPGYVYFDAPMKHFSLIDNYGNKIIEDSSSIAMNCANWKMLSNGYWACINLDRLKIFNEDIELIDEIPCPTGLTIDIHDCTVLNNGHYLLICLEERVVDLSSIIEGGNENARVEYSVLIETDNTGQIYWYWDTYEHFDILDVTSDIDLTSPNIPFTHSNSVAIDLDRNILLSSRHLDEITKIAYPSGNIIWRMGGSECKNNEFTFINDTIDGYFGFSHQHSLSVLANGNYLLFDNGNLKPMQHSRAVEYYINLSNKIVTKAWEYRNVPDIFSVAAGNTQRLSNGNTFINFWDGNKICEVRQNKSTSFEITFSPVNIAYRAFRYVTRMNAKSIVVSGNALYDFNGANNENTKVKLNITSHTGSGTLTVEKHDYKPAVAVFSDSNFTSVLPYRWVLSQNNLSSISANIRINVNGLNQIIDPDKITIYKRNDETKGTLSPLNTSYNNSTGEISANISGFGEIVLCQSILANVTLISPNNNKNGVAINDTLKWQKVTGASNYLVQLSNNINFSNLLVNEFVGNVSEYRFNLDYNTEYFWRISALNNQDTSDWSDVFSFTTKLNHPELTEPKDNSFAINLTSNFSWTSVEGASYYRIQIAQDELFKDIYYEKNNCVNNHIEIEFHDYNKQCFWRVCGYNTRDTSAWSEAGSFTTIVPIPELITPIKNEMNADIEGELVWNIDKCGVSYNLELSSDSLFNILILDKKNISAYSQPYWDLVYDKDYYWRVRSHNSGDTSIWSAVNKFSTRLAKVNLTNPINNQDNIEDSLVLYWDTVSGATKYNIQIAFNDIFSKIFLDTNNVNSNQCPVYNLTKGMGFYWRVKAENDYKYGDWSDTWSFKTKKDTSLQIPILVSPSNNSISEPISNYLVWLNTGADAQYYLQVSENADFSNLIIDENAINQTHYTYNYLKFETKYYWRVRAFKEGINSDWSDIWNFTTVGAKDTSEIKLLEPQNGETGVSVSGVIQWEIDSLSNSPDSVFKIEISENPNFAICTISEIIAYNSKFQYDNLLYNKEYFWRVGIINVGESILWSSTSRFITELESPNILSPENGSINNVLDGLLSWEQSDGATGYALILTDDSLFINTIINESNLNRLSYNYTLPQYTTFYWQVKALSANNTSQWSKINNFTTLKITDVIENPEIIPNLIIYNDNLHLSFNHDIISDLSKFSDNWTITINNLTGIEVYRNYYKLSSVLSDQITINLNCLSSGIYFVSLNNSLIRKNFIILKNN